MDRTYVRLVCPECTKRWEAGPADLPAADEHLSCPNCHATRRTAEFARTDHDLETLKRLG